MSRDVDARVADVARWLTAARAVYANRASIAHLIARATGLPPEGVELGFASLERDASDTELRKLVALAGRADRAHVILSANVFVAPLRAIAIARAAADNVTIRPSPRDPVLVCALVEAAGDAAITLVQERDVASITADEIHVYGRDDTIAAVRARARSGVIVRGHGAGMGVALVTRAADADAAADALAADVVPFDQRGCLSPRIAIVEGSEARAASFARSLDEHLRAWGERIPRGVLSDEERADTRRWREALAFVGRIWEGDHHTIAVAAGGAALGIPPSGRNVLVVPAPSPDAAAACLAPIARFVVVVGTDDLARGARFAPTHARVSPLGRMQRPPLDGPIDRRSL
jgi:hypothetical protein